MKHELYWPRLNQKLAIVEAHLEKNRYLMGDEFTLPDSYLMVILIWLAKLKVPKINWRNLARYYDAVKERETVRKALIEEDLMNLWMT